MTDSKKITAHFKEVRVYIIMPFFLLFFSIVILVQGSVRLPSSRRNWIRHSSKRHCYNIRRGELNCPSHSFWSRLRCIYYIERPRIHYVCHSIDNDGHYKRPTKPYLSFLFFTDSLSSIFNIFTQMYLYTTW